MKSDCRVFTGQKTYLYHFCSGLVYLQETFTLVFYSQKLFGEFFFPPVKNKRSQVRFGDDLWVGKVGGTKMEVQEF